MSHVTFGTLFVVDLKFKSNWEFCILSGDPSRITEYRIRGQGPNGLGATAHSEHHTLTSYMQISLGFSCKKCNNSYVTLFLLQRIIRVVTTIY